MDPHVILQSDILLSRLDRYLRVFSPRLILFGNPQLSRNVIIIVLLYGFARLTVSRTKLKQIPTD